ncbi:AAA family ATPase [Breznakiellaceae bacterium SP9]
MPLVNGGARRRICSRVSVREALLRKGFSVRVAQGRHADKRSGSGRAFFLSRPRRFGKSLLCSTLGAIFEGREEVSFSLATSKS